MERTRGIVTKVVVVIGLGVLLFLPARGAISLSPYSQSFFDRLASPLTPIEAEVLGQYRCYEDALAVIPDGSPAWLHAADANVDQRMSEIAYPRIRLVTTTDGYGIYVDATTDPPGTVVLETTCGAFDITVVEYD